MPTSEEDGKNMADIDWIIMKSGECVLLSGLCLNIIKIVKKKKKPLALSQNSTFELEVLLF